MLKRELEFSASAPDAQQSPAKRHKDDPSQDVDVSMSNPPTAGAEADASEEVSVKEQGLQLWNAVKNAVSKECVFVDDAVQGRRYLLLSTDMYS
jgi:hypothetical protein